MGFLDNSTSNIVLDAVLTDTGRRFLSRNDGSFSIVKFACFDDECDYTIIQKFGRTVGKEKIEKNTAVFEALTNGSYAGKSRLISVSNPNLIRLPNLILQGEGVDTTGTIVSIGNTTIKSRALTTYQTIVNEQSIDVELRDQAFVVEVNDLFLQIVGAVPDNINSDNRATYILLRDAGETALGGSKLSFTVATKAITNAQFQIYGAANNKSLIATFCKIYGINSGAVMQFEVDITQTT